MNKVMTPSEAAELLHMDARTLLAWARKGYLPAHALGEGKRRIWRFFEAELLTWIHDRPNGGKKQGGSVAIHQPRAKHTA